VTGLLEALSLSKKKKRFTRSYFYYYRFQDHWTVFTLRDMVESRNFFLSILSSTHIEETSRTRKMDNFLINLMNYIVCVYIHILAHHIYSN